MDDTQNAIKNAIKLANIDFEEVFNVINSHGSINPYIESVEKLGRDFEEAFSLKVLNSSPIQIKTFAKLNLLKIDLAIKGIEVFENYYLRDKTQIDLNPEVKKMIEKEIRPIQNAHLNELKYIKRLLNTALENIKETSIINKDSNINNINEIETTKNQPSTDQTLNEYGEYLTIKDLEKIFHVKRNTIYRWENEGKIARSSKPNMNILYKKEDIIKYLSTK